MKNLLRHYQTKLEQFGQARRIHGGLLNCCVAAVGVKLARMPLPLRLRLRVFRTIYGGKYPPLDENELQQPLESYKSLDALFTRGVNPTRRPFPEQRDLFICPCDSRIQEVGRLERDAILTLKGIRYSLPSLLPGISGAAYEDGHFAIFFLAPDDCHRIFCPQSAKLEEVIHVPGYRLLVHPPFQRAEYPVFALNERLIFRFTSSYGPFILVMVAGWGVGHMTLARDTTFRPRRRSVTRKAYQPAMSFERGDWLATFGLGSTVLLILPRGSSASALMANDQKVKYGEPAFQVGCSDDQQASGNGQSSHA